MEQTFAVQSLAPAVNAPIQSEELRITSQIGGLTWAVHLRLPASKTYGVALGFSIEAKGWDELLRLLRSVGLDSVGAVKVLSLCHSQQKKYMQLWLTSVSPWTQKTTST